MKVSEQLRAAMVKVASEQPMEKRAFWAALGGLRSLFSNPGVVRAGLAGMRGLERFGSKAFGWLPKMFGRGASAARAAAPGVAGAEAAGLNAARNVGLPAIADPWAAAHTAAGRVPGAIGPGVIGQGSNWKFWGNAAKPSAEQMARGTRPGSGWNPMKSMYLKRQYADDLSVPQRFGKFLGRGAVAAGVMNAANAPSMVQNAGELGAARALAEMKGKMSEGNAWDRFWRGMGYAYAPDETWANEIAKTNPNIGRAFQYFRSSPGAPSDMATLYAALTGSINH